MLNKLLSLLLKWKVKILHILPTDNFQLTDCAALVTLDIVILLEDRCICNVEVQKIGCAFPSERASFYSAGFYIGSTKHAGLKWEDTSVPIWITQNTNMACSSFSAQSMKHTIYNSSIILYVPRKSYGTSRSQLHCHARFNLCELYRKFIKLSFELSSFYFSLPGTVPNVVLTFYSVKRIVIECFFLFR